jgi:hypothetical protein
VTAYSQAAWHNFFMGSLGASAAFTGLLFVAISINLQQILKFPRLPGRAAGALGMLLSALFVSSFGLAPGESHEAFGIEIACTGLVVIIQAVWVSISKFDAADPLWWTIQPLAALLLPGVTFVAGGISVAASAGGGLYWVLAGTLLAYLVASMEAWVLLIEILR